MRARMLVPHGRYAQGELVSGATAKKMVADGFATRLKAPATKAEPGAPENKSGGDNDGD